jgi:hypothetical protein
MGTSLTGLTPATTYDALIKVGDNGPLSGTLKRLSDGLGNDSAISLSTGELRIDGSTTTIGSAGTPSIYLTNSDGTSGTAQQYATLGTSTTAIATLFRGNGLAGTTANGLNIDNFGGFQVRVNQLGGSGESINLLGGNVGIGTISPQQKLQIGGSGGTLAGTAAISFTDNNSGSSRNWVIANGASASGIDQIGALTISRSNALNGDALAAGTEIARFSVNGLSFNGDTAAANALDEYEEGTWTMGISFGGGSTGIGYTVNTGTYTKIGRQVTVNGQLGLTSKGSSTGSARITGLPFTIPNSPSNLGGASLRLNLISFLNQFQGFGVANTTTIALEEVTSLGTLSTLTDADFTNDSDLMVSFTYFV